jgi:hypothetical protein
MLELAGDVRVGDDLPLNDYQLVTGEDDRVL